MGNQIVSQPDHGDTIVLEGEATDRLQLYFDDITEKLNTFLLNPGAVNTIYTVDDTILTGRIATLTDTLSFRGGQVGFSNSSVGPTDGTVHIINSNAGIITAPGTGNLLVLEQLGSNGMSFLQGNGDTSNIFFGSPNLGNQAASITFDHLGNPNQSLNLAVAGQTAVQMTPVLTDISVNGLLGASLSLTLNKLSAPGELSGIEITALETLVNPTQSATHDFRATSVGSTAMLFVDSANNRVGVGRNDNFPSKGFLHVQLSSVGAIAPDLMADDLVVENGASNAGITIFSLATFTANLFFGNELDASHGGITYLAGANRMSFRVAGQSDRLLLGLIDVDINPSLLDVNLIYNGVGSGRRNVIFGDAALARVGINTGTPTSALQVVSAVVEQFRLSFDATHFITHTVTSDGSAVVDQSAISPTWIHRGNQNGRYRFLNNKNVDVSFSIGTQGSVGGQAVELLFNTSEVFTAGGQARFHVEADATDTQGIGVLSTHCARFGLSTNDTPSTEGVLHIIENSAGVLTASTLADLLILEDNVSSGMSFLNADTNFTSINFGSPLLGNTAGSIFFSHAVSPNQKLTFQIAGNNAIDIFPTDVFVNPEQAGISFQVNTDNDAPFLRIVAADDRMGLSQGPNFAPTDGILHIHDQGTAGVVTAHADADAIVLESNVDTGLSFLTLATGIASLYFGSPTANNRGIFRFDHNTDFFETVVQGVNIFQVSSTLVGISRTSLAPVHGALHIQEADAGVIAPSTNADLIVLEGIGEIGMSFLVDNATGFANLNFGDPSNGNAAGQIRYDASAASWFFSSTGTEMMRFNPTLGIVINETGATVHDLRVESVGSNHMFFVDSGNNRIGIANNGFAPSDGLLHLFKGGAAGVVTASTLADGIVMESNAATGFSILVPNDGTACNLFMGAPTSGNAGGKIIYVPFTGLMTLETSALPAIRIDTDQNILLGTIAAAATSAAGALHIPNDTSPTAVLANAIVIGSKDSAAGGSLAVPELWIEEPPEVIGTFTPSHKFKVWINGTEYFIQLDAV